MLFFAVLLGFTRYQLPPRWILSYNVLMYIAAVLESSLPYASRIIAYNEYIQIGTKVPDRGPIDMLEQYLKNQQNQYTYLTKARA